MIVSQFHVSRILGFPAKANPVLAVHANAVLPRPVSLQRLDPAAGRNSQIVERHGPVQQTKPPSRRHVQSPPNDAMPPAGTTTPCHGHNSSTVVLGDGPKTGASISGMIQ